MIDYDLLVAAIEGADALPALIGALAQECGARSATLQYRAPGRAPIVASHYFSPAMNLEYVERWIGHDLWVDGMTSARLFGRAVNLTDVVPDRTFANSVIYNEFFRVQGDDTGRAVGAIFPCADGAELLFAAHRAAGTPDFTARERATLDAALAAVRLVMAARVAVGAAKDRATSIEAMLAATGAAMIELAKDGRVLGLSQAAHVLLSARDGLEIADGRLHIDDREAFSRLARARAGRPPGSEWFLVRRRSGAPPYHLRALPTPAGGLILTVTDPASAAAARLARARNDFELTAAETVLLGLLVEGRPLREAAASRGVTIKTARAQLSSILAKTRTRRQSQLIGLIAQSPGEP